MSSGRPDTGITLLSSGIGCMGRNKASIIFSARDTNSCKNHLIDVLILILMQNIKYFSDLKRGQDNGRHVNLK